ncbi:hypothetical protein SEA_STORMBREAKER8_43 [Microbacterium phage Stormbreaker8]|nr:hypothetical protein SEA_STORMBREAKER8_43 [Microbacterium phage Stormbreaker8]
MSLGSRRFWDIPVEKLQLKGHTIDLDPQELSYSPSNGIIQSLVDKLNAEMARLHRLLPEAPPGFHWVFEEQRSEDLVNNVIHFRMVATLKEF